MSGTVIKVGSINIVKVESVKEIVQLYPNLFNNPKIVGVDVAVEEYGHPNNIDEVFKGAIERAEKAFIDCDYSIGLESGFVKINDCDSGYMEINGCVIFDGYKKFLGLSSGFEWPIAVTKFVLDDKGDASLAYNKLGYTKSRKRGAEHGGILGELTHFRMTREDQIKQSIISALIYLENPTLR